MKTPDFQDKVLNPIQTQIIHLSDNKAHLSKLIQLSTHSYLPLTLNYLTQLKKEVGVSKV